LQARVGSHGNYFCSNGGGFRAGARWQKAAEIKGLPALAAEGQRKFARNRADPAFSRAGGHFCRIRFSPNACIQHLASLRNASASGRKP
jgi:hypothetical protein